MAREILVDDYIDEGEKLIQALDLAGINVTSALWYFDIEAEEWFLIIATDIYDKEGPLKAYEKIIKIINDKIIFEKTPLWKLKVVGRKDFLINQMRGLVVTGPEMARIRIRSRVVNNFLIEEAFIYRLR